MTDTATPTPGNFLEHIIADDVAAGRVGKVVTRFPPEPNGYLHLGHAKAISVNFELAAGFGGECLLRFDDTNPTRESREFIASIQNDITWLGYQWQGAVRYTSAYFRQLYEWAVYLTGQGDAYVCELSAEQAREYRGSLTRAGRNSPYRERPVAENLALLADMKAGRFAEGHCVLRAKIDMAAPNMNLRDPIIYRIRDAAHHQTGTDWCIYPTYDFAHGQADAIEGVTHSICTLEFADHRPLYDWFIEHLPVPARPRQYEFGRLNPGYTVTSKRKLKQLVEDAVVSGWDDPRMPTLSGMRRRGYTARAIRKFCTMVGTTRSDGLVDIAMLEHALRTDLNEHAPRALCVINPLKLILTNYPEGQVEPLTAPRHPVRAELGSRALPFTREIVIERDDFREQANKKFRRLVPGRRVRLRNACVIEADSVQKDAAGTIVAVHCRVIADSFGRDPADGIKPRGVIHWVSASAGQRAEIRLYERLFTRAAPDQSGADFMDCINPDSLRVVHDSLIEPGLAAAEPEQHFQFERLGYFVADRCDHRPDAPVFNRIIGLRDNWSDAEPPA